MTRAFVSRYITNDTVLARLLPVFAVNRAQSRCYGCIKCMKELWTIDYELFPMLRAVLCTVHVPAHYTKDEMFRHLKSSCGEARATAAAAVVL